VNQQTFGHLTVDPIGAYTIDAAASIVLESIFGVSIASLAGCAIIQSVAKRVELERRCVVVTVNNKSF
jgi:hypothetical protein